MISISKKISDQILQEEKFKKDRKKLFSSYINHLTGQEVNLEKSVIKRLSSSIQFFHKSENEEYIKEGNILLSMLLDISGSETSELIAIAKHIFVNSGDFPNIRLLEKRHPEVLMDFGFITETKFDLRKEINSVDKLSFPLTDFQRKLWDKLEDDEDIITVAPTSAGKTHIILTFLVNKVINSGGAFAAIIVPTRALISEVAGKVFDISSDIDPKKELEICTIPKDAEFSKKTIFVMTQERLYELTQRGDLRFDYLFIDEAHNISDESRGVLLHLTLEKILDDSSPQIIISMPSESYQNSFSSIFNNIEFKKEITRHSPVSKILISVESKKRNLEIARYKTNDKTIVPKGFTGTKIEDIVMKLGKGQSNIIYRNQTDHCERTAKNIASLIDNYETTPALEEAADYIETFIHQEFTLAENLRKGVAFHYGPLPGSVRVMIENLVKSGDINFIACTSTLAEGVNLPAKNLFLSNPARPVIAQPSERLEDVKVKNITGRAGRMIEHFSGNIFLISHDSWTYQDYFDDDQDKVEEKIPTYYKTLNENLDSVIQALNGIYPHDDSGQYRFYTIANKLIKELENGLLDERLNVKELTINKKEKIKLIKQIEKAHSSLTIAPLILEANPTIGYIQQNRLSNFLDDLDSYEEWLLPHPKSKELYSKLLKISKKLNELGVYINTEENSIEHIAVIASKWISGKGLKEIISEQIKRDKASPQPKTANQSIRSVIKAINNDITFRLRNALSCYHTLLSRSMKVKDIDRTSVKIHTFLEIGACDDRMINLINLGLSREAAKEIDESIPVQNKIHSMADLHNLIENNLLSETHKVTQKEVKTLISK